MPRSTCRTKDAVEPILTTVQTDGSTGYYSIMVARKDSGITKLEDLKGKKLGFADPDSTSGYLIPVTSLPKSLGGATVKDYFAETGFGGGHENLVLEVLKGTFDAGTTFGSGVGEFKDGYTSGNLQQDGRQGHPRHGRPGRSLEVAADPERPDRRPHLARRRHQDQVQGLHDRSCRRPTRPASRPSRAATSTASPKSTPEFYQPIIDARKAQIGG